MKKKHWLFPVLLFIILVFAGIFYSNVFADSPLFYSIIDDFSLFLYNKYLIFYSHYHLNIDHYSIMGMEDEESSLLSFVRNDEIATSPAFPNNDYSGFAYSALFQQNDVLWIKDLKKGSGFRIIYNISGYLKKLVFSDNNEFMILSFLHTDPLEYIYFTGIYKDYTYPVTYFPNLQFIMSNEESVFVCYKKSNKYFLDQVFPLENPWNYKNEKIKVNSIDSGINTVLFHGKYCVIYEKDKKTYLFDGTSAKTILLKNFTIIQSKEEENILLIIDNLVYDENLKPVDLLIGNNAADNYSDGILAQIIRESKDISYLYPYLILDNKELWLNDQNKLTKLFDIPSVNGRVLRLQYICHLGDAAYLLLEKRDSGFVWYVISQGSLKTIDVLNNNEQFVKMNDFIKIKDTDNYIYVLGKFAESVGICSGLYRISKSDFSVEMIYDYHYIKMEYLPYYRQ